MRVAGTLLAACAALTLLVVPTSQVLADPPGGVTPRASDVVGVGSDTIGNLLDQFSRDYDPAHQGTASLLYSWDATNPVSGKAGDLIVTKAGCKASARPDGSLAGLSALEADVFDPAHHHVHCVDYAGSSVAPAGPPKPCSADHICYLPLAIDAVTWAARATGSDAPKSLTLGQLKSIYSCKVTNWAKVGGHSGRIEAFLPPATSGTSQFWLTALGLSKPGSCVRTVADNEGISPKVNSAGAIVPYSVADYLTQVYRDAPCANPTCTGSPPCTPTASQNQFGCDTHGVLAIGEIGGSAPPTLPWPLPKSGCKPCTINPKFTPALQRLVYVAVHQASTPDRIPAYLEPIFGGRKGKNPGWVCSKPQAKADIAAYGFLALGSAAARSDVAVALPRCGTPYH